MMQTHGEAYFLLWLSRQLHTPPADAHTSSYTVALKHSHTTGNQTCNLTPHLSGPSLCLKSPFCRQGLCFALLPRWMERRSAPRCFAVLSSRNFPHRCPTASWRTPSSAATDWTAPSWSLWSVAWRRPRSPTCDRRPRLLLSVQPAACAWSRPGERAGEKAGARGCRGPRAGRKRCGGSGRSHGSWRSRTSSCRGRCRPLSPERCGPGSVPPLIRRRWRWRLVLHILALMMKN